jgi:hypothetical protein
MPQRTARTNQSASSKILEVNYEIAALTQKESTCVGDILTTGARLLSSDLESSLAPEEEK